MMCTCYSRCNFNLTLCKYKTYSTWFDLSWLELIACKCLKFFFLFPKEDVSCYKYYFTHFNCVPSSVFQLFFCVWVAICHNLHLSILTLPRYVSFHNRRLSFSYIGYNAQLAYVLIAYSVPSCFIYNSS